MTRRASAVRFPDATGRTKRHPSARLRLPDGELPAWYAAHAYLRPVFDDAPFFQHFVRLTLWERSAASWWAAPRHRGSDRRTPAPVAARIGGTRRDLFAVALPAIGTVWRAIFTKHLLRDTLPRSGFMSSRSAHPDADASPATRATHSLRPLRHAVFGTEVSSGRYQGAAHAYFGFLPPSP
jgi:hypothetical protein